MKILIKNGRVIDPYNQLDKTMDVLIVDGKILKVQPEILDTADRTIDANGMWVVPGLIDLHVHLRDPGFEYKETIQTGTLAAAAGGFTTICCMPNTKPVTDSVDVVKYIMEKVQTEGCVNVLPIGSITKGQQGLELADIEGMASAGICAISEDGKTVSDSKKMKDAMEIASGLKIPIFSHCEDISLVDGGVMNQGKRATELGLSGISNDSEDIIISRDIVLAKSVGAKLHICHVSTNGGVEIVEHAQKSGVDVTAEACPHHFSLWDDYIDGTDANFKMNPPLRTKRDVDAIIQGLKTGVIGIIATDHAPHHEDEKNCGFEKAANGVVGLETAVAMSITKLVHSGILTPSEVIEKLTINPAKILGIDKGTLSLGAPADVTIIDPNKQYKICTADFSSKGKNSPFDQVEASGKVMYTLVSGTIVYEHPFN